MNTIGLKIPTGGRQCSWLFTNMAEEEPWSATKQLQLSGQSTTWCRNLWISGPAP